MMLDFSQKHPNDKSISTLLLVTMFTKIFADNNGTASVSSVVTVLVLLIVHSSFGHKVISQLQKQRERCETKHAGLVSHIPLLYMLVGT